MHAVVIFVWSQNSTEVSLPLATTQALTVTTISLKPVTVIRKISQKKSTKIPTTRKILNNKTRQKKTVDALATRHHAHARLNTQTTRSAKPKKINPIPIAASKVSHSQLAIKKIPVDTKLLQQRLRKQLNLKLAFSRHYPAIAIRNDWQGTVNIAIHIQADGQLSRVRVISSSGYRVLDHAAVNSIIKINSLPEARHWLNGDNFDVILPVIYQLADS